MRALALLAIPILTLSACAPPAEEPRAALGLDCAVAFDDMKAALVAQPNLKPAPKDPAEPYRFYSTVDGRTSYLITEAGAPGHPAILMQRARGDAVITTGCPYGDKAGYEQVKAYLEGLKSWRRK